MQRSRSVIAAVERGKLPTASAREALTRIETDVVDPARHATIVIEAIVEDLQSKQQDGVATAQDIDLAMELGYERRMGPLRVSDLVGLDVRLNIANHLHRTLEHDSSRRMC